MLCYMNFSKTNKNKSFSFEEVSKMVITKTKKIAEAHLHWRIIVNTVNTVLAKFNHSKHQASK